MRERVGIGLCLGQAAPRGALFQRHRQAHPEHHLARHARGAAAAEILGRFHPQVEPGEQIVAGQVIAQPRLTQPRLASPAKLAGDHGAGAVVRQRSGQGMPLSAELVGCHDPLLR